MADSSSNNISAYTARDATEYEDSSGWESSFFAPVPVMMVPIKDHIGRKLREPSPHPLKLKRAAAGFGGASIVVSVFSVNGWIISNMSYLCHAVRPVSVFRRLFGSLFDGIHDSRQRY